MDDEELTEAEEEAHYYSVLTDMVDLMTEYGPKKVVSDLLELLEFSIKYETVSKSIN